MNMNTNDNHDALAAVITRNVFYKKLYYLVLSSLALAVIVIFILIGVLVVLVKNPPQPLYFAVDNISRLIPDVPLNQANMSIQAVMKWTVQAVEQAYSYDFVNFRRQLQSAQKYFTRYGWTQYMSALQASNNLTALKERKMIFIAKAVGQPTIVAEGLLGGAYAWKFQMPVLVTYLSPPYDEDSKFSNPLTITVLVQRQAILQSDNGLGIVQSIATLAASPAAPQTITNAPAT